jgi:hypothetical protein
MPKAMRRGTETWLIALIDQDMPVIVIVPNDGVLEKTISNMQEVAARGGSLILIGDSRLARDFASEAAATIVMQDVADVLSTIAYSSCTERPQFKTAFRNARFIRPAREETTLKAFADDRC